MDDKRFKVIFSGKLLADTKPEEARTKLAELFKLRPHDPVQRQKLLKLFSGRPVVIKQDVSRSHAQQYVEAIARCGGICRIENMQNPIAGAPNGIERRCQHRRIRGDRRAVRRASSIQPDRRIGYGRRITDQPAYAAMAES